MHELSVVLSIVDIATEEMKKAGCNKVDEITLDIGCLSTIEMYAFDFAWEQAVKDTPLAHARKHVNRPEGLGYCASCDLQFSIRHLYDACPTCASHLLHVRQGKEMCVRSLLVS